MYAIYQCIINTDIDKNNMEPSTTVRINITIPKNVWNELEKEIPGRKKSKFIADAIVEKLRIQKKKKAFLDLASLPPTFAHIPDGAEYITTMRKNEDIERSKELNK